MYPNGLINLIKIWNQDFLGDDALFKYKYHHSEKSDKAPLSVPHDKGLLSYVYFNKNNYILHAW